MAGICGWAYARFSLGDKLAVAERMASILPGPGPQRCEVSDPYCIGYRADRADIHVLADSGVVALIEGTPRWRDGRLAALASVEGPAKAAAVAYIELGKGFLSKAAGIFSLAIIDPRGKKLLLATDRMGVRPVCYSHDPARGVIFGSTCRSVLASDSVPDTVSAQSIYDYFFFHLVPSPATIYAHIHKLQPAQYLEYNNGSITTDFYWTPDAEAISRYDGIDLEAELLTTLRNAVSRCNPNSSTAAFLSGGLDSSTISGITNEFLDEPLRAYSMGFEYEQYNELEYARIAADHFGLNLTEYYVTSEDVTEAIDLFAEFDEPFGNSSVIPAYICARLAKEGGATQIFAGDGGDELFAGNERYLDQQVFEYYWRIPKVLRGVIEPLVFSVPTGWSTLTHKAKRYIEQARLPMPDRLFTYTFPQMHGPNAIFEPEFLQSIDQDNPLKSAREWYSRSGDVEFVQQMLQFDWKLTLADNDIRKVNMACDLAGIQVAYPMLDDELIELSLRIPVREKLTRGKLRAHFKKSLENYLPREILEKKKHGFGLPFGEWLESSQPLQDRVEQSIEQARERGIFRKAFLDAVKAKHATEHAAYFGGAIWVILILEEWLSRRHASF